MLQVEGSVSLQLSAKSVGLFEAFYSSIKPVAVFALTQELQKGGKLPDGVHELPFEFPLEQQAEKLLETYHGVFVNVQYVIGVEVKRGVMSKNLKRTLEFIVEAPEAKESLKARPRPSRSCPSRSRTSRRRRSTTCRRSRSSAASTRSRATSGSRSPARSSSRSAARPSSRSSCSSCASRRAATRTAWRARRPRSRTSRSPTAPSATAGRSRCTWSSRASSRAPRCRRHDLQGRLRGQPRHPLLRRPPPHRELPAQALSHPGPRDGPAIVDA